MKLSCKVLGLIYGIGLTVLVAGVIVGILWPSIVSNIITTQLTLTPTSTNYELWKETPIPMYLKIYMFNWTNPNDFKKTNGEKPNFVELGPYVFRQVDYKVNQVWNDDNGTITYQRRRVWHYDETLSDGTLEDKITNLNPIAATVANKVKDRKPFWRDVIDRVMVSLGHKVSVTKSVKELLFEGYSDTMLVIAEKFNLSTIPFDKFGWFYERNGTDNYDGTFNMMTGVTDLFQLGMLREWNFRNRTDYYEGECGIITGSNGELWPPLPDDDTISVFVSDICTDVKLRYANTTTFLGLTGNKFISDETMLDNGTNVPSRKCYYQEENELPSGMLDISQCKYEAPAFISLPHFYLADPIYRESITGMNPTKDIHEMSLAIEPTTGIPLQVKAQLQLNLLAQPDAAMSLFRNVKKTYMPMLWFTQEANLTSNYASKVKFIMILPSLGSVTFFGIAAIGALVFFIGLFLHIRQRWQGEETQVLLPNNDNYDATRING